MSLVHDILTTYRAPRVALRRRFDPAEHESGALITLVLACGLVFVAQWPRLSRVAFETGQDVQMLIGATLLAWVFFMPLVFYVVAGALGVALRLARLPASGYRVRMATFWALLAAAPLWLLWGLTAGIVGPGAAAMLTGGIALAAFIVFWGAGLVEAASKGAHHV